VVALPLAPGSSDTSNGKSSRSPPPLARVATGSDDDYDVLWCDHWCGHWLMTVDDVAHPNGRVAVLHGQQLKVCPPAAASLAAPAESRAACSMGAASSQHVA
jgi:hypothetical protein